jgi:hypothetical protein
MAAHLPHQILAMRSHQDLVNRALVSDAGGKQAQFPRTLNCCRAIARIEL